MTALRPHRARLGLETLESRLMLDAKLTALPALASAAQTRTLTTQPLMFDAGMSLQTQAAVTKTSAVSTASSVMSVVTIRNQTNFTIYYALQWPGYGWQQFSVAAYSSRLHWYSAQNAAPQISYDKSFAPGIQEQRYSLPSRDFAGARPTYNTDGMQYYFTRTSDNKGIQLYADATLNKSALSQYRAGVTANGDFPRLMSNFEVLAAPTRVYNCIAHSLGYHDRWVNPITSSGPNKLAGMDNLYRQQGYTRLSSLDYTKWAGYQKVVVYAKVVGGVIQEVTHAAIQSSDGTWSSKLGANALIKHLYPDDLSGGLYGQPVAVYYRRG